MPYIGKQPARVPVTASDIPDNSITTAKIVDGVITVEDIGANAVGTSELVNDAVTADKLANSINAEIAANTAKVGITTSQANAITANTAKVSNATHTGDVTGSTTLTIAAGAVDIAMMSATGTASSTTYLRGDNSWAAVSSGATGGGTDQVFVQNSQTITTDYTIPSGKSASCTGPITMNAGVDITLSAGSRWVIL